MKADLRRLITAFAPGIGLAATQVNGHLCVVVMDLSQDRSEPMVYINPEFEAVASPITTCKSFEECKAIADETQQFLSEELPYVVLFTTTITEPYRSDSVEFPFTNVLDGLQNIYGLPNAVYARAE